MKTAFYLELGSMQTEEIIEYIRLLNCARDINCHLSPHCIEYKGDKLLLIAVIDGDKMEIDLWSYASLGELGEEGYKLQSSKDKYHFFTELVQGEYKWVK
jgi:hypothetical protein